MTLSIVLHELAHGAVAIMQGDSTPQELGHMSLNPIVHMGWGGIIFLLLFGITWGQMPVNPTRFHNPKIGSILVSMAGPLANFLLACVFIILAFITSRETVDPNASTTHGNLLFVFQLGAMLNLILCLFNLLPVPPLDGFKVAEEILPFLKNIGNNPSIVFLLFLVLYNIPGFWSGLYGIAGQIIRWATIQLNLLFL